MPFRELTMRVWALQALEDGAYAKAEGCLTKLLAAISTSTDLHMMHAKCLLAARKPIDAARAAQKALALDEDHLPAYVLRAEALHAMGQVRLRNRSNPHHTLPCPFPCPQSCPLPCPQPRPRTDGQGDEASARGVIA